MFSISRSNKHNITEDDLVNGLGAGGAQRRASEKMLYELFFYFIGQGIRKYRLSDEDCATAYSDTIINVIENIVSQRFESRSTLKTYCYQIFMNKCVDLIRKKTTHKNMVHDTRQLNPLVMALPDKASTIIQQLVEKSDKLLLIQKLKELGDKCKEVLLLFEDGYSDREIALQMNYQSPEVVKTTRLRCLGKLREKMLGTGN